MSKDSESKGNDDMESILQLDNVDNDEMKGNNAFADMGEIVAKEGGNGGDKVDNGDTGDNNNNNDDDEEEDIDSNVLLQSLNTDVEKYHKKVQLKKNFDNPNPKLNPIIQNENNIEERVDDNNASVKEKKRTFNVIKDTDEENGNGNDNVSNKKHSKGNKKSNNWTKIEDDAIVYYKEEMKYSWRKIEQLLEFRHTWQAIQMRYLRNHKSRNEEWSRYMEIKFVNAVRKDWENRWKRIANDLGNSNEFTIERCVTKNIELCKKIDFPYYSSIFENKEVLQGYNGNHNDIKDSEAHKKLMLVYMGLDAITYEDSENENENENGNENNNNNNNNNNDNENDEIINVNEFDNDNNNTSDDKSGKTLKSNNKNKDKESLESLTHDKIAAEIVAAVANRTNQ
ncbi:hypothetical protein DAPK24_029600 [Pichia kluyveri]|uniref:Myb-like domain-containing protein n=1 Tax=Pichia kluyveri TaxID=36015 RepID=A0AAV5R551_PICKL|nr:hypothetical protein DAPK24_029600 [Pichia kluyveri]